MNNDNIFTAIDRIQMDDASVASDGYLYRQGNLARTGIQEYLAHELGIPGMDAMRVVRLYRPPEEVFDPTSMASFDGKPVTVDHPSVLVTSDNWKAFAVGDVSNIGRNGNFMTAKVALKDKAAIDALSSGKRELSNGYNFQLDMTPGTTPDGQAYDGVQRNIRGNHIALVSAARCGSACRISDSQPSNKENQPMTTRKVVVDGITVEVSDTAADVIGKLEKDRDAALALAVDADNKAKAATEAHKVATDKLAADHKAEIEALKKDVITPAARDALVADWAAMLAVAKRLAPDVATDGKTCLQVRREALTSVTKDNAAAKAVTGAVLGAATIEAADAELVRKAFDAVATLAPAEAHGAASASDGALAAALAGSGVVAAADSGGDIHDLFVQRMTAGV